MKIIREGSSFGGKNNRALTPKVAHAYDKIATIGTQKTHMRTPRCHAHTHRQTPRDDEVGKSTNHDSIACTPVHNPAHKHTYIHTYTHTHTRTHTRTHTHTHIHIHTHTHTHTCNENSSSLTVLTSSCSSCVHAMLV